MTIDEISAFIIGMLIGFVLISLAAELAYWYMRRRK